MNKPRRFELLEAIAPMLKDELVISNIGFPSQEWYSLGDYSTNFYMLGSMGLSSSIGLGVSLTTDKKVVSIDGDGSVLMNLGTLVTIANQAPANFILLIVDNGAYGSTGDQPTYTAGITSLAQMARGAGMQNVHEVEGLAVKEKLAECLATDGPHLIVAKAVPGSPKKSAIPLSAVFIRDRFKAEVMSR